METLRNNADKFNVNIDFTNNNRCRTPQPPAPPPPPLRSNQNSMRKSIIKISSEQVDRTRPMKQRIIPIHRTISSSSTQQQSTSNTNQQSTTTTTSNSKSPGDDNRKSNQRPNYERTRSHPGEFCYQSPFDSKIELRISSPDPIISRMLSQANFLHRQNLHDHEQQGQPDHTFKQQPPPQPQQPPQPPKQSSNGFTERCYSPMSSSGYETLASSPVINPFRSDNLFDIQRSMSTNRFFSDHNVVGGPNIDRKPQQQQQTADLNNLNKNSKHVIRVPSRSLKQQHQRLSLNDDDRNSNETSISFNEIIQHLDQIERRIQFLREISFELLDEKQKLSTALNKISAIETLKLPSLSSSSTITEVDKQDIRATIDDLQSRLQSIQIIIKPTTRNKHQRESYEKVLKYLDSLRSTLLNDGKLMAKKKCLIYLNSCTSDVDVDLNNNNIDLNDSDKSMMMMMIDEQFQRLIIDCSIDDQKLIRKMLKNFLEQIDE